MDERAAIDILTAKVQALEARLAELSSSDAGKVAAFGGEAAIKPTVDPKGRKIWESEWVMDHGALMCYVPDNALIIDGQNVAVEADDKEGAEVTLSGGSWYLHVFKNEETGEYSADFDDEPTGSREGETAKYNIRVCDINEKGYIEKQYVVGSIVLNSNPSIVGDKNGSEYLKIGSETILLQGFPGNDGEENVDHSGIMFLTVSGRTGQGGVKIPPKIIATIKDKLTSESWSAKTMTVPVSGGGTKIVHFLGCDNVDLTKIVGGIQSVTINGQKGIRVTQSTVNGVYVANILNIGVTGLVGYGTGAKTLTGDVTVKGAQGSGLVIKTVQGATPSEQQPVSNGEMIVDLEGRENLDDCQKNFGLHQLKYKDSDGNIQIYHVLSCGDIDLTREGKLIKSTTVTASAAPNGMNTIKFIYTDGTYDEFKVMNGMNGSPGSPGKDGDTPEITAERQGNHVYIYADGDLIATIEDGQTPQITAQRTGTKQTTIYANGIAIAVINDGEDGQGGSGGEPVEQTFISNIDFSVQQGKIVAYITKKVGKFIGVSEPEGDNPVEKTICEGTEVEVVTTSAYHPNTTGVNAVSFVNGRKKIHVISLTDGTPQTVFTATKLSDEH